MVKLLRILILAHKIIEGEHHRLVQIVLILVSLTIGKPNVICKCKRHRPADQKEEVGGGGEGFVPVYEARGAFEEHQKHNIT